MKSSAYVYGASAADPYWFRETDRRVGSPRTKVERSLLEVEGFVRDFARADAIRKAGALAFPLERLPRTTRAQAMDVLSSQAGMAGYKAVLIAAQFWFGIPGTVGGAVWGNAGAFGASISDRITEVEVTGRLSDHDEITSPEFEADNPPTTILDRSAITFGYRTSSFQIDGKVILQVDFEFYPDDPERLARRVEEVLALRRKKHPSQPSAGSFFKNLPLCRLTASQQISSSTMGARLPDKSSCWPPG